AGEEAVPELIQGAANPESISSLILRMFCDKAYREGIILKLGAVREKLGGPGASKRAAEEIVRLIG
ncbi:MAG: lipid-A-disaccharide synthase, partial [Nitrospirota bacterium]